MESELMVFLDTNSFSSSWKVTSDNPDITFRIEQLLIARNNQLVLEVDSTTQVIFFETKGSFALTDTYGEAKGIMLFKVFVNNSLVQSKRVAIEAERFSIIELPNKVSQFWEVTQKKETEKWNKWYEPSLILGTMAVSIYLLFSVRS
jgi:hypothetical protein